MSLVGESLRLHVLKDGSKMRAIEIKLPADLAEELGLDRYGPLRPLVKGQEREALIIAPEASPKGC